MSAGLPFAYMTFDGERLRQGPRGAGRRLRIDARCLVGDPVEGATAHVCALADPEAALRFALAWWIGLLGTDFICLSTFALDASRCAGAVTVARTASRFRHDPFARLFPGTVARADFFCAVPPPPGPVIERYGGAPWPGGSFAT